MIIERNFTNKPSIVTIKSTIRKAVAQGGTFIIIRWGENQINVEQSQWGWIGRGWIGRNGGHDIAYEMNKP
jgi:hypothetical protein